MADAVTQKIEQIIFVAIDGALGQMVLVGDVSNGALVPLAVEATEAIVRTCVAPLQAEVVALRMRSGGAEYDLGLLLASLDERESDIADLRAQLAAHAATVGEQAATVGELEAEGVRLADEAIALRLTVEAREQTIAALRRQYTTNSLTA